LICFDQPSRLESLGPRGFGWSDVHADAWNWGCPLLRL
jgi:hypothetical protein